MLTKFSEIFESGAVQRIAILVDLEKCCKMSIWTQKSASIQKRTSCPKFAEASKRYPTPVISLALGTGERGYARAQGSQTRRHRRDARRQILQIFRKLVLAWIDADLRVQILILQHFSRSLNLSG